MTRVCHKKFGLKNYQGNWFEDIERRALGRGPKHVLVKYKLQFEDFDMGPRQQVQTKNKA
eukprot:CAMPEP_0177585140 /NCGR_PEP_ID=MMETSP0419_2-20121207/4305_1 /TAXON_ID=582737 /ORGANISM="Tetraselmis sp., Strain GSL018" /LENGTH=59 /DNA_ID=CAMNT_0019074795 /DNA_START=266 /DNA_END=445 /DNA_ORIENTATION=-